MHIGLAVVPTWIVVREHVPVEAQKEDEYIPTKIDEDAVNASAADIGKLALVQSHISARQGA